MALVNRRPRTKTNPHRILTYALFAEYTWIRRYNDGLDVHVSVDHTPLRNLLRLPPDRLRTYITWLLEKGYIRDLHMSRGRSDFVVRQPATWNWSGDE